MILMHKVVIDLQGFDESQFGIFDESDRVLLTRIWEINALRNPNTFIAMLSPEQKQKLTMWAIERTSYNVPDIITAMEKFVKYLKTVKYRTYPRPNNTSETIKKKVHYSKK